ncbi:cyclic nucleotide-binding protein [Dactylosporangium sp. NPDC006015]|uniref:cyclic nucleotide-binding protein n=1 Tax=Dactylosporangium sp. NPDC006015 TaxID=3154576 RepID=UPI0033BC3E8E
MAVIETRISVWEALAGRAPGVPLGPADQGLWQAVTDRLNPARARPVLRKAVEAVTLTSARGVDYVMVRSPDRGEACYLRLTPDEWSLAQLMDGTRTVARLVADFARIAGRLAPDQVTRVVADLAGNRMLDELPVDAFHRLHRVHRRPWPIRLGKAIVATAQGRRVVIARVDPIVTFLYKAGGRLFFTRVVAVLAGLVALAGLGVFVFNWFRADQSVFLTDDSYFTGALVLLGLNVVALACHELGHALGAKHAGRKVPVAGFLVYFGIPSVFVDTTDVWMAGRRARLVTTIAGPATGLVLAGACQLVGLFYPELEPWTFKLAFAWYLNALFNLNPFMALDGYYLLMDWLEVPNLRARGLAWVIARLRRRPPRFGELDREGRLVALYGMLAVVWLAIAVNLMYRIYTDRVAGVVTGLWNAGWAARALLAVIVAGLLAPLVYLLFSWLRRRARRVRDRMGERKLSRDEPRRLAALRASKLADLPPAALAKLAEQARWVHPRTGEQLVFAGAAQQSVYVVVDGALEARRPGDPTGTVRERVGRGGVVGLANAITGAPAALGWLTAGTTLLAIPPSTVAAAVGPLSGPPPVEWAELEALLAEAPALADLGAEDRLGLMSRAHPAQLMPGQPVHLETGTDAIVVASGSLLRPDGVQVGRGAMIGPYGEGPPGQVATARSAARVWVLPAVAGLPLLIGASTAGTVAGSVAGSAAGGRAPLSGAHPPSAYPPLAAPPGVHGPSDDSVDKRFERKLWWLLVLLLIFALFLTGSNLFSAPVWAEMPTDRALITATRGQTTVTIHGEEHTLRRDGKMYVELGDAVSVADRSTATMTFRGGSVTVLCAGTRVDVGELVSSVDRRPIQPTGAYTLRSGRTLVDTTSTTTAFEPLKLTVTGAGDPVANDGRARFALTAGSASPEVGSGVVTQGGSAVTVDPSADLTCGDGIALPKPGGTPTVSPGPSPSDTPSESPSPSVSPSASESASVAPTTPGPTPTKTKTPGPTRTTAGPPPPTTTTAPPPRDTTVPVVNRVTARVTRIYAVDAKGTACNSNGPTTTTIFGTVSDKVDSPTTLTVTVRLTVNGTSRSATGKADASGNFSLVVGPFPDTITKTYNTTGDVSVSVTDPAKNTGNGSSAGLITFTNCMYG